MRYIFALMTLAVCGCLCEPETISMATPEYDEQLPFVEESEPVHINTAKPLAAVPAAAQKPAEPVGFTGVVAYLSEKCDPCECLQTDLHWLRDAKGWKVSYADESTVKTADIVIEINTPGVERFPLTIFYKDGQPVDAIEGYVNSPNFSDRINALGAIVEKLKALKH